MDEEDNIDFNRLTSLVSMGASGVVVGPSDLPPALFLGTLGANSPPRDTTPTKEVVDEYMKLFIEE